MNNDTVDAPLKFHTLESLTDSQRSAIDRIPAQEKAENIALESKRPTSMFLSEEYFAKEQQKIFATQPVAVTVSAALAENNTVMANDGYGVPLLITRDKEGKAHVFLNACTHKGATLITANCDAKKAGRVTCPFHAWSFALNGDLIGVAREETFANLDKQSRNLVELPSLEAGGVIWAKLHKNADNDFSALDQEILDDLDALEIGQQYLYGKKRFDLSGNWKQIIEPFLEGYHVQRLHAQSVGPLFSDVPTVVDKIGHHIRQVSGKIQFSQEMLETDGKKNIHKIVTHAYLIFPNTVVITSPYYMSVMIIMPSSVGKTIVDYHFLTLNPADNPQAEQLYKLSYETVLNVFGNEDFAASETCYTGLKSGALDDIGVVYSGLEKCIPMNYETLDKLMNA